MTIRFFLLDSNNKGSVKRTASELKYIFGALLADDRDVQIYPSLKAAASDISRAAEHADVLVFLADYSQFASTKLMISKAFGLKLECNKTILEKAKNSFGKTGDIDEDFAVTHAFVPDNAHIFTLNDGAFSGFAAKNGKQTVIVLPLAQERTHPLLTSQLIPYINSAYNAGINAQALKKYHTERLAAICEKRNIEFAAAGTNTARFFKEYISSEEKLRDAVKISAVTEKRGNIPPADYIVNLSLAAAELFGCKYSMAISNAYYTGNTMNSEKTVYLAITNERETYLREIISMPGEEIIDFLIRCCNDLCAFAVDTAENDAAYEKQADAFKKTVEKRYKAASAVTAALICALCLFTGSYFSSHNYSLKDWYSHFTQWVFPAGLPFSSENADRKAVTPDNILPETTKNALSSG